MGLKPRKCTESNKDWDLQIINEETPEQQLQPEPKPSGGETEDLGNIIEDTTDVQFKVHSNEKNPAPQTE